MKNILLFIILFLNLNSQTKNKYWIYFESKNTNIKPTEISDRAIERRKKVSENIFSIEDFPIDKNNITYLKNLGIKIENQSNWLNAVTAFLNENEINILKKESKIKLIEPVVTLIRKKEETVAQKNFNLSFNKTQTDLLNYGASYNQLKQINVVEAHNHRINGKGVLVGMLDSGFRWRIHEATKNLKVISEYDFIQKDSTTSNQAGDSSDQDHHGTTTMSTLGGYFSGKLIGPAYASEFILGKTEYVPTETNIEEDNWAVGIEWMEKNGVDVVSSSLGYSLFDAGQKSYSYSDMDGRTAITTKAAVIAARKGVVVCTAMGNEGNNFWKYLTAPADADSIISVGAVNTSGNKTGFSSFGPTFDKRIKPDLCALGSGVFSADASFVFPGDSNLYGYNSGTSLSTPLVAGTAAVLLSAFPELNPIQVRDALRNTASKSNSPDTLVGWGIVDLMKALHSVGIVISPDPEKSYTSNSDYEISFYITSSSAIKKDSVFLFYSKNNSNNFNQTKMLLTTIINQNLNSGKYSVIIPRESTDQSVEFFVKAKDGSHPERKSPWNAPTKYYSIPATPLNIGEEILPQNFELFQNYPNPFNSVTILSYNLKEKGFVTLKIYDLFGREIKTLVNENQFEGKKKIFFNASELASGTYFYKLKTNNFTDTKKLILIK